MIAVVWADRERRYFICKNGSLRPGTTIERSRWRQFGPDAEELEHVPPSLRVGNAARVTVSTNQPELVEKYYSVCSLIDQHRATEGKEVHFCNPFGEKRKQCSCTAWVDHIKSKHPRLSSDTT